MKKKKEYGQMKIVSLDGSTVYKHSLHLFGLSGLTVLKNGKVDTDRFRGVLDESLDTIRLEQLCKEKKKELPFPFTEQGCTRALVNVRFDHAVKLFEQYGRRYIRYGYSVTDENMNDHVCIRYENDCPVLVAVEVPYDKDKKYEPVENPINKSLLGKYFEYDEKTRSYRRTVKEIPSQVKKNEIREYLYKHGFDIDGVHYVRYKRSAGSSRQGHCLFIAECFYEDMMQWSRCGLCEENVLDQASWQSYIALTLSSIEKTIKLPKKAILVLPDEVSRFVTKAVCVEETKSGNLTASEKETEVENILWDGEGLLDVSVFEENGYADNGMMLLRNRFFKTCAFNTNLQAFFKANKIEKISQLQGYTVARKVEDIKLVVTESSLKFMKFLPEGVSRKDGYVAWLNALYEGKDTSLFGVVKTDKEPSVMNGYMAYANYQLLNTVGLSRLGIEQFLAPSFEYLNKIRNDPMYMRYHAKTQLTSKGEMIPLSVDNYKQHVITDMLRRTDNFAMTEFYKAYRSEVCKRFKDRMKDGKIVIEGGYQTLFGNPMEFLYAVIGAKYTEPELYDGEIYTTRFEPGERLLCARSPHITMGNLFLAENVHSENIDACFNLTPNIVCVNAINSNLQHRLNGCDYDSDTMLITNNEWLIAATVIEYDKLGVPVCMVKPSQKTAYTFAPEDLARLDCIISENKIGDIVNLSQFINSIFWHELSKGKFVEELMPIYLDICKLAVLSGMEIDKAKRMYSVDTNKVLTELGKYKTDYKESHSGKLPRFFKHITEGNVSARDDDVSMNTPMSFIFDAVESCNNRSAKTQTVKLVDLFDLDVSDCDANDTHRKQKIIQTVKDAYSQIQHLQIGMKKDDEKQYRKEKADELFEHCLEVASKHIVNDHVLHMILKEIDNDKKEKYNIGSAKSFLFAVLLYEKNKRLLNKVKGMDTHIFSELMFYEGSAKPDTFITESIYGHRHVIYDFETMK